VDWVVKMLHYLMEREEVGTRFLILELGKRVKGERFHSNTVQYAVYYAPPRLLILTIHHARHIVHHARHVLHHRLATGIPSGCPLCRLVSLGRSFGLSAVGLVLPSLWNQP